MSDTSRAGFSLVELMVAMVILSAGLLAMASASGFSSLTVQMAGNRTARAAAVASELEGVRARAITPAGYTAITSKAQAAADTVNGFAIWYTVTPVSGHELSIAFTSSGRSFVPRQGWIIRQETFTTTILKPGT